MLLVTLDKLCLFLEARYFSDDVVHIDEDYREWCDNEEEALVLSDRAIDEIAEWISNSDHHQDALKLINGYYTNERDGR